MTTGPRIPVPAEFDELPLANLWLADAVAHTPTTDAWDPSTQQGMRAQDVSTWKEGFAIVASNGTNQVVTVTILGCSSPLDVPQAGVPAVFSETFDVTITVPANGQTSQTYTPGSTGWLAQIWCSLVAAGLPAAAANVRVVALRIG